VLDGLQFLPHLLSEFGIFQLDFFESEVVQPVHFDKLHPEHVIHS
jgi:hypothetical protein